MTLTFFPSTHPKWRETSDETKYTKMLSFAQVLPLIRKQVNHDLSLKGMPKEQILATVVHLLQITLIRVGNEEYVRENKSYGLTTLLNQHVTIKGSPDIIFFANPNFKLFFSHFHTISLALCCFQLSKIRYPFFQK